jgi:hypothetical protein
MKILSATLLMLLVGASLAEGLTIRVQGPTGDIAPQAIAGFNVGLSMVVVVHLEEFGALTLRTIRYPPGNDADDYPLTTDRMDAFKAQWEYLGEPDILLVANYFDGPEQAVVTARYFEEIGVPIAYWAIGNEPDLYPRNRMNPVWTAELYCEHFRLFADALRSVHPDAVITGPAISSSQDYLAEFVRRCGDVVDVLTWHVYPTDGTWGDAAALATSSSVGQQIRLFREWLRDPATNPLGHERDIGLAITEFGLSWRTTNYRHLEDIVAALWLADALGQMAVEGLDMSHYFALQAMGGHGLIDRGGWIRPTYHVYEMLSDFSGEALAVDGATDLVTAYAARNERGTLVLLVNGSTDAVEVVLEGLGVGATLEVATLDDAIFDEILGYRRSTQDAGERLHLPPRSVVTVRTR